MGNLPDIKSILSYLSYMALATMAVSGWTFVTSAQYGSSTPSALFSSSGSG